MKRGSALLIVLGMMSFMVVSAVAFSIFMRQSRLPSSFLRQRQSAAQLVKAGLAGAMSRIDAAIGRDPYPGVGQTTGKNYWRNRVLVETPEAFALADDASEDDLGYETVSTLTLEGLAHLPPALVNTVRHWSKLTPTAAWAPLGYDAGRYAFTAVNVSDYFDINRVRANAMRDSSPENRISMGYLFENDNHTSFGTVGPAGFATFIGNVTNDAYKTRFVSLADYNLAIGSGAYGDVGFKSPFCEYIKSPPPDGSFYGPPGPSTDNAKLQKFVSDSWFPAAADEPDALYLTDEEAQPLNGGLGGRTGLDPLMKNAGEGFNEIKQHLNLAERAALVDYLDEDNVPISLALPTAERAPMVTGLQIVPFVVTQPKIVLSEETEDPPAADGTQVHRVWKLDSFGELKLMIGGSAVYPFKREHGDLVDEPTTFPVQVLVKAFLSKESQGLSGSTRSAGTAQRPLYRPKNAGEWTNQADMNTGVYTFLSTGSISVKPCKTESDALCTWTSSDIQLNLGNGDAKLLYGISYVKRKVNGVEIVDEQSVQPDFTLLQKAPLMLRDAEGNVHPATELVTGGLENLKLNLMVWVRVMDGDDTVDLVPAMIADDQVYNRMPLPAVTTDLLGEQTKEPIMPVDGPVLELKPEEFKPSANEVPAAFAGEPKGLHAYCNDPRFNWAPEDWFAPEGNPSISPQGWLNAVQGQFGADERTAGDIFQFVSNMGYMQSMGEIQFIPLVRKNGDYADFTANGAISGGFFQGLSRYDRNQPFASTIDQLANRAYMWKSRFAYGAGPQNVEANPFDWGIYDSRGGSAVNPYADQDLMMAAIANTPIDYIAASADNNMTLEEGRKYTFGPGSSAAQVKWEELQKVAQGIKNAIGSSVDWETAFNNPVNWDAETGPFGADFGDSYHDVDRKFLYSYWRSCFANSQQLFLVFVRAEPAVVGGSSAAHTPSQLGARAVALVWREPVSSVQNGAGTGGSPDGNPHRMRILFYHQFE